jgi:hypothetical protein
MPTHLGANPQSMVRLERVSASDSKKDSNENDTKRQQEIAQYVSEMILELRNLARTGQLYEVMVALEYAYYEAFSKANQVKVPAGEVEHIRRLERAAAESEASQNGEW